MAKSRYDERFRNGYALLTRIRDEQVGRLRRAQGTDRQSTINDWIDLARAEKAVKERYRGRYLFELIQNANDAIIDASPDRTGDWTDEPHLVRFELTEHSLLVANYGKPFSEVNVRALCRLHTTTKIASKQIGHKGIGFKSVLEISERPEIYSINGDTGFAFGFDGHRFWQDVSKVMGAGWDSRDQLPILRAPYARSLAELNPEERKRIDTLFDDGYATVVRLPWEDEALVGTVSEHLEHNIEPTLLLFMTAISQIEIALPDGGEVVYFRDVSNSRQKQLREVKLFSSEHGADDREDSRWLLLGPIERPLPSHNLVEGLGEAWKGVEALSFSLAFPLDLRSGEVQLGETSRPFYVYFPTQEYSGLSFAVQADFHVRDDRKHLDTTPLNVWLVEEICAYIAGEGLELLKGRWPHAETLVEVLAPISKQESEFSRHFMSEYLKWLRLAEFVPVDGDQYKTPEDCRFPPKKVDAGRFRMLFPASRLRGHEKWAYPLQEVIDSETKRNPPFLLTKELGAEIISVETVLDGLDENGLPPVVECGELMAFFSHWWDRMDIYDRTKFVTLLKDLRILPTTGGWIQPGSIRVFQANLRSGDRDLRIPSAFEFAVIVREAYPEQDASHSNQWRLFGQLGASDYQNREIIRSAILPVLTSPRDFQALVTKNRTAVVQAYELLKEYQVTDGSTVGFQDRLAKVFVPATDGRGWTGWKPAGECYLGMLWPKGDALQRVYSRYDDCFFLDRPPELDNLTEEDLLAWSNFFCWLGVMRLPKLLGTTEEHHITGYSRDPFRNQDSLLWSEYTAEHRERFFCKHPTNGHGFSRRLRRAHTIQHFADLVRERDRDTLITLHSLVADNWQTYYSKYLTTRLECMFTSTRCPWEDVENYLIYQLQSAPWLIAQVGENLIEGLSPKQIWLLGETETADVRKLVPTLPAALAKASHRALNADLQFITPSTAQIEDYVRLLRLMPDRFPLEIAEADTDKQLTWYKSVRAVFNWICERIQTGLVARSEGIPEYQSDLRLLVKLGDKYIYEPANSPRLVFPDNKFMEQRWNEHCAFLHINDDWRRLREWLGVSDLSGVVTSDWFHDAELTEPTRNLGEKYRRTIPYYLTLVRQSQPANYERILGRLTRLRIHVVRRLEVTERIDRLPSLEAIATPQQIHLKQTDDPNPRGGRTIRAGDLWVTGDVLQNLDLLGEYIADYIEITRLADAFVVLINRDAEGAEGHQRRMQFLASKGITERDLEAVISDLRSEEQGEDADVRSAEVLDDILRALTGAKSYEPSVDDNTGFKEVPVQPESRSTHLEKDSEELTAADNDLASTYSPIPTYPNLLLDNIPDAVVADGRSFPPVEPFSHKGVPRTQGSGSVPSSEAMLDLGRRGEEWVYAVEKKRLAELGLDVDLLEEMGDLKWVSAELPTANHDIRSVTLEPTGIQVPRYIEVKATSGESRIVKLSKSEFEFAAQEGDRYWLYWVSNIDTARPDPPVCFRNLFRLIAEKKVELHVDTLSLALPDDIVQE